MEKEWISRCRSESSVKLCNLPQLALLKLLDSNEKFLKIFHKIIQDKIFPDSLKFPSKQKMVE